MTTDPTVQPGGVDPEGQRQETDTERRERLAREEQERQERQGQNPQQPQRGA